jgi:hypothetical protein
MPTDLPDISARSRRQREELCVTIGHVVAVLLALLVLGWNIAVLEAGLRTSGADLYRGDYNPMEISKRPADAPAQRGAVRKLTLFEHW